jgi:RNA polymerase sigma-70 factor (ECF subfamily)
MVMGSGEDGPVAEVFERLRSELFAIAYRMTATVSDAGDLVQEAFLRYTRAVRAGVEIASPRAWLSTVVTRLAIDEARSARARRETYVGQWLPEPLLTDADDPAAHVEQADSLSMAFLLLLDRLSPAERAVFLLHDVFGYAYDEVAGIVEKSAANCRQLAHRARTHLAADRPRFEVSRRDRDELAARFFAAVTEGDLGGLLDMLAADVVVYGDGGGKAPQWMHPIGGARRVARLLAGLGRGLAEAGLRVQRHEVNGQPGALVLDPDGRVVFVLALDIADGVVQTVRSVINPDKLDHLGPVADAWSLLRQRSTSAPASPTTRRTERT